MNKNNPNAIQTKRVKKTFFRNCLCDSKAYIFKWPRNDRSLDKNHVKRGQNTLTSTLKTLLRNNALMADKTRTHTSIGWKGLRTILKFETEGGIMFSKDKTVTLFAKRQYTSSNRNFVTPRKKTEFENPKIF